MPTSGRAIELAAITGAHGVNGELRLKLFGEGVEALSRLKHFNDGELKLTKIRSDNKGGAIARLYGISNRREAERLRGTVLSVSRDALPSLEDGEYYHADLIGLRVESETGEYFGTVAAVQNYGATDIIEVTKDPVPQKGMKSFMLPMTKQAVLEWDAERIVIAEGFGEK